MGEIIEFPIGDIEFRRAVRGVERLMRDCLADGPQLITKVRRAAEHITKDTEHFEEARCNLGVRLVEDPVKSRWYWAMPGDETKVPNATQYSYLTRRER